MLWGASTIVSQSPPPPTSWTPQEAAEWKTMTEKSRRMADTYGINSPQAAQARKDLSALSDKLGHQRPHQANVPDSRNNGNPGSPNPPDGAASGPK